MQYMGHTRRLIQVVEHMTTYLQDVRIGVFMMIRVLLLLTKIPETGLKLFIADLLHYKEACHAHVALGQLGPFVRFLQLLFQDGKVPFLVESMHGVASQISPQAVPLLMKSCLNNSAEYKLGIDLGRNQLTSL